MSGARTASKNSLNDLLLILLNTDKTLLEITRDRRIPAEQLLEDWKAADDGVAEIIRELKRAEEGCARAELELQRCLSIRHHWRRELALAAASGSPAGTPGPGQAGAGGEKYRTMAAKFD